MAYLKSDKSTLEADRGEVLGNISHIIPGILYPAVKDEFGMWENEQDWGGE